MPQIEKLFSAPCDLRLIGRPKRCLLIFDDEIWEKHILTNKSLKIFPVTNAFGRILDAHRYLEMSDEKILLVYPTMGAAGAVCDMELLIASGIEKIVAFGTCGRLDRNIARNMIILPTGAYREEGTSYHYLPDEDEIDVDGDSLRTMENIFKKNGFTTIKGKIWTTDAVYRETVDKVALMKTRGCIGVDIELSALLALAKHRDVKFAEFLIGDDAVNGDVAKPLKRT